MHLHYPDYQPNDIKGQRKGMKEMKSPFILIKIIHWWRNSLHDNVRTSFANCSGNGVKSNGRIGSSLAGGLSTSMVLTPRAADVFWKIVKK
jgi:hypothetical protein